MPAVDREAYAKWIKTRPQPVQDMAARFPPWNRYRRKVDGVEVEVFGYEENRCCGAIAMICLLPCGCREILTDGEIELVEAAN